MKVMPQDSHSSAKSAFSASGPYPGVNGVGVGQSRSAEDVGEMPVAGLAGRRADADVLVGHVDVERARVRLGVDGNGGDAELPTGADDAQRDFPAVGDKDLFEHGSVSCPGDRLQKSGRRGARFARRLSESYRGGTASEGNAAGGDGSAEELQDF